MLIDWFTVGAQVINFLILIWLLKRFLYRPILHAIDARETRIASVLAAADAKEAEAQKERDTLRHQNEEFNEQRATLLKEVTHEATVERKRLVDEARCDAEALRLQWKEALRREQLNFSHELTTRIEQEVFSIARKVFMELANTKLESQIVDVFLSQQRSAKDQIVSMTQDLSHGVLIRTGFDLSSVEQTSIEEAIQKLISASVLVQFETSVNLISGIELIINGQKMGWSMADYLSDLQNQVDAFFQEHFKSDLKTMSQ
ncbi:hypothetical protein LEAN103870_07160 [Legionella anisa]|uniref:ATP synthase subunit b n=1 Tax=Legionella anisa TaxID=28082 RepID=A0AAX0X473_9GAMM|nr:hypothetical protein [Legionella anisa]KTC68625.1 putative F0F1-type ATP synthase, subunit b [Legionella anisa]PNL73969.1 F0F1 ATP synthase subunit B [Legionella anisa]UAK81487.1 hypothetical protein K8O89_18280 [Legionella anisa]